MARQPTIISILAYLLANVDMAFSTTIRLNLN